MAWHTLIQNFSKQATAFIAYASQRAKVSRCLNSLFSRCPACLVPGGGGGALNSWEFWVGVCRPVPLILTRFQTKQYNFPHSFSDYTFKIHIRFQTWLRLKRKQKNYSNPFLNRIFLFLFYSFGIETINTFIHSAVPSKLYPIQDQNGQKCIPVFRPKPLKNLT